MLRLTTLGRLELESDGAPVLPGRRKLLAVLAYLARTAGPVTRARLADLFWPGADEERGRRSVRQALTQLRRAVPGALREESDVIFVAAGMLRLDADELEAAVARNDHDEALRLWGGDFLAGLEDVGSDDFRSWLEAEREALRRQLAFAAAALADQAERAGAWERGLAATLFWTRAMPDDPRAALRHRTMQELAGRREALGSTPSGDTAGQAGLFSPDLVAREEEFALLTSAWGSVRKGESALVLVEGDEGTGKTRLTGEFLRSLTRRTPEAVVLRAKAFAAERDHDGVLLRQLLVGLADAPGLAASPPAMLRSLADVVPEVAERFRALWSAGGPAAPVAESVARSLADVAVEAPVVVAVDDAHEADARSREVLEHLYRHPPSGVLLLLASLPDRFPVLGDPDRVVRIRLGPLGAAEVERMLASMAELAPADRRAVAERLHRESGGYPLGVVELANALADEEVIAPGADGIWRLRADRASEAIPLPPRLREAHAARLRQLSPDALRVLEAAAVLGRASDAEALGALAELDAPALEVGLRELIAGRLLLPSPDDPASPDDSGRLDFPYETMRRAVNAGMSAVRRRSMYARARQLQRRASRGISPPARGVWRAWLADHRARGGPSMRGRVVAAGAVAMLASLAVLAWHGAGMGAPPSALRVASVSITSPGEVATPELPETIAELLRAVLRAAPRVQLTDSAPAGGATITGTAERSPAGVRLHLTLHDPARPAADVQLTTTSLVSSLPTSVYHATRELLAGRAPMSSTAPYRWESVHTSSIPALYAYLVGERLMRTMEIESADRRFGEALTFDHGFAAAWSARAEVAGWFWAPEQAAALADSALAYAPRGGPEASIVDGWRLLARGQADSAEELFRTALGEMRDDPEPNVGLGWVLYQSNWARGRPREEARAYLEAAARADPGDWRPYAALWEMTVRAGRRSDALPWLSRIAALARDPGDPWTRMRSMVQDSARLRRAADDGALARENEWVLAGLTFDLVIVGRRPADAERVASLMADGPAFTPQVHAFGHEMLAQLALAGGRWREARSQLDRAAALEPVSAATVEGTLALAPWLPRELGVDTLRVALRRRLAEPPRRVAPSLVAWFDFDRAREGVIRPYLRAMLAMETGAPDTAALRPIAGVPQPESLADMGRYLDRSLTAHRAAAAGRPAAALAALDGAWEGIPYDYSHLSVFYARPWDIYLKAELLHQAGRDAEAERWYDALGTLTIADLVYRAPAQLERARILERLGRAREARAAYAEVVGLWAHADPEFQPAVDSARARIEALRE